VRSKGERTCAIHFFSAGTALTAGAADTLAEGAAVASTTADAEGTTSATVAAEATSPGLTSDALHPINAAAQQTIVIVFFIVLSPVALTAVLIIS